VKDERLNELQAAIDAGRALDAEQCSALLGEVWRLKSALTGKKIETAYWRENFDRVKAELDKADQLNREFERQKALFNQESSCYFENTWSSCALRQWKKAQTEAHNHHGLNGSTPAPAKDQPK
jgi:hypothetical protein